MNTISNIEILLAKFLDFAEDNAECKPMHIALYAHILITIMRLGKSFVALPTDVAMQCTHITSKAYYSYLADLAKWGAITCNPNPAIRHTLSYTVTACEISQR